MEGNLKIAHVAAPVTTENERRTRSGKFTLGQLRQTDGLIPLQSGTNQFDSQKGKTGFGMPRNTSLNVQFADNGKKWTIEQLRATDSIIRLQSGTNKYDSQRGMTGFGTPRDVRGKHLKRLWEIEFPEETMENIQEGKPVNAASENPSEQPPAITNPANAAPGKQPPVTTNPVNAAPGNPFKQPPAVTNTVNAIRENPSKQFKQAPAIRNGVKF